MIRDAQADKVLLDLSVIPFEPRTGSGQSKVVAQVELLEAIRERISSDRLEMLRRELVDRLVRITVFFNLWKGASSVTNTRPVKDLDNLLKVVLDVLKAGPLGLGLVKEDSFICEICANKKIVEKKENEGYRILIEPYEDEQTLRTLREFYSRN